MISWWKLIAQDAGADASSGAGSWKKRTAAALGLTAMSGASGRRMAVGLGAQRDVGSWDRRLVYPSDPGTVGSWARRAYETQALTNAAPTSMSVILADFVNGIYRVNGSDVAVGDLFETDAGYGWTWDEAYINADGFNSGSDTFRGAKLKDAVFPNIDVDDCTVYVEYAQTVASDFYTSEAQFYGTGVSPYYSSYFDTDPSGAGYAKVYRDGESDGDVVTDFLTLAKTATTYKAASRTLFLDGVASAAFAAPTYAGINTFAFGFQDKTGGIIKKVEIYSSALSDAQVVTLTSL